MRIATAARRGEDTAGATTNLVAAIPVFVQCQIDCDRRATDATIGVTSPEIALTRRVDAAMAAPAEPCAYITGRRILARGSYGTIHAADTTREGPACAQRSAAPGRRVEV